MYDFAKMARMSSRQETAESEVRRRSKSISQKRHTVGEIQDTLGTQVQLATATLLGSVGRTATE